MIKKCLECRNKFSPNPSNLRKGGGKYCSMKCYHKQSISHKKGVESPFWKGSKASIASIHDWLKSVKGSANKCENSECLKKSNRYDWALLKGRKYEDRNLSDYWQLCRKCHKIYDFIEGEHPRNKKGVFIKRNI